MAKTILRRIFNRLLGRLAMFLPGATSLRPALHRLRGVKITGKVWIGDDVYLENEYPENVELQDGAQIALKTIVIAHTRGAGRIVIGKNSFIGTGCLINATTGQTLTIGEGAVIKAATVVSTQVPSYTLFGAADAKPLAKVTVPLAMGTPFQNFILGLRPLDRTGLPACGPERQASAASRNHDASHQDQEQ
ncbi:acyltransferase [Geomonas paludis]|uniref:Acyltransferase n=1 Tax=Geomonas paludis TaxID=2740185 RepID=A0ABY4LL04_9BACT|nr:acyltransferase [Geomonas paludis]UPU37826.1 acyltransferase [Geomonas paludis]